MTKTIAILFSTILLCYGCGQDKPVKTHQQTIAAEGFNTDTSCGTYKRYTGTIAGQQVVLHYMQHNNTVHGEYYYENIGQSISLYNYPENTKSDKLIFTEMAATERQEGSPRWEVSVKGDSITGRWFSADSLKSYPILLKENFNGGVQHFGIVCVDDSVSLKDGRPEPRAQSSIQLVLPVGNDDATSYIRTLICKQLNCDTASGSTIKQCLDEQTKQYFADYKSDNGEEDSALLGTAFYNWSSTTNQWVSYNEDNMVVINQFAYEYTGGAHGNYHSNYLCIDSRNKKLLTLQDILTVDEPRLIQLLEAQTRKLFQIADGEPLNGYLLTDSLHVPDQFYISKKGITFVYGIYEIAAYANGEINLFIPYSKIQGMLTPYFKERMKISSNVANK